MQRSAPMKRTGFSRKPSPFKTADRATTLRRSGIKKKARKAKAGDDKTLRDACRDEPCYLQFPGICKHLFPEDTIVPAHRNEGKGGGLKNPDHLTLPACFACHYEYDQGKRCPRPYKRETWDAAFEQWEPRRNEKLGIEQLELEAV